MAGETLLQVKNSTGYSWDSNPAKGERGGGDKYDPHRRPVDDDPYDRYVSQYARQSLFCMLRTRCALQFIYIHDVMELCSHCTTTPR